MDSFFVPKAAIMYQNKEAIEKLFFSTKERTAGEILPPSVKVLESWTTTALDFEAIV